MLPPDRFRRSRGFVFLGQASDKLCWPEIALIRRTSSKQNSRRTAGLPTGSNVRTPERGSPEPHRQRPLKGLPYTQWRLVQSNALRFWRAAVLYDFTSRFFAAGSEGAAGATGLVAGNGFTDTAGKVTWALATALAGRTDL